MDKEKVGSNTSDPGKRLCGQGKRSVLTLQIPANVCVDKEKVGSNTSDLGKRLCKQGKRSVLTLQISANVCVDKGNGRF